MKFQVMILFALSCFVSAATAYSKVCNLEITGNDLMQYNTKLLEIDGDCKEVHLTLKHVGKTARNVMGHNWVLTTKADMGAVSGAGMASNLDRDYLPDDKSKIIAYTKIIGGGESISVKFPTDKLKAGDAYTFFCTFPGHFGLMQGEFKVKPAPAAPKKS